MKFTMWTLLLCTACILSFHWISINTKISNIVLMEPEIISETRLKEALDFCEKNQLNTTHFIAIDMSKRSGSKRMFLVNFTTNKIALSGLVAHGHCKSLSSDVEFSNEVGSNCTSDGRYKLGAKYNGAFGTSYKLHGLDSTNSNAFKRFIVLHGHSCVPDQPSALGLCRSEGCPTVSLNFLQELDPYLTLKQPMLLWIYK